MLPVYIYLQEGYPRDQAKYVILMHDDITDLLAFLASRSPFIEEQRFRSDGADINVQHIPSSVAITTYMPPTARFVDFISF